jgi:MarR family 2-MHQ and catechol resistance regulon transcriptional repressor
MTDARSQLVSEALVAMLVAAGHLTRDLNTACEKHGITHDQYNVLRILRGVHPDGHPRSEISNRLISRAPDVTRMLDRLERRGLVKRGWDPSNRRLSIATITRDGLALLQKVDQLVDAEQARATADLTKAVLEALRAISRSLQK